MKVVLVGFVLFASLLQSAEYTKEDRIKDMNEMAQAMNVIQSGFFYNNYETVEAGFSKLTDAIVRVKPPLEEEQEKYLINKYMNQKIQMSNKIVKKINQKALTILQRFKDGDSAQAVQAYTKIMGQCIQCHREMRNW